MCELKELLKKKEKETNKDVGEKIIKHIIENFHELNKHESEV